jgi:catechol 2,3-dioxygenase-like lactoylglutathione lyase family enzyme
VRLDHVALATRDVHEPLAVLVGRLGGTVTNGGNWVGFRSMQLFHGDDAGGMKIELLEPWEIERTDFLERFLARHGDGPHHLTFKVDDLEATLADVAAAGITPVSVDLSTPEWREAFLLPRDAEGTVVQLASSTSATGLPIDEYRAARADGAMGSPTWWPDPPTPSVEVARLRRVVLRTRDLDAARRVYVDLLGGTPVDDHAPDGVVLEWPGGGRIALEPTADGAPGIDRLELEGPPGELTVAGTRLVVRAPRRDYN